MSGISLFPGSTGASYSSVGMPEQLLLGNGEVDLILEEGVLLSWVAASDGRLNPVLKYVVQEKEFTSTGSEASDWRSIRNISGIVIANEVTRTTITVYPPSTMGRYKKFRVMAMASKGVDGKYDGGWAECPAFLYRKVYTSCSAPSNVSLSTELTGYNRTVTLSWSGARSGTNNPITGYQIWRSINGGTAVLLSTVILSATSGSETVISASVDGTEYTYYVITLGTKQGFDSVASKTVVLKTKGYTACTSPESISISKTATGFSRTVTLSWSGAKAGSYNPITAFRVYRSINDGEYSLFHTEETTSGSGSISVVAGASHGMVYRYYIVSVGTIQGYDSSSSSVVSLTSYAAKYTDRYFLSSTAYTIPASAERLEISCIGGGGGSGGVAYDYGEGVAASGGGGGTGEKTDRVLNAGEFTPGASVVVTVGSAGAEGGAWSPAGNGGDSSFGAFLSARGGTGGSPGVTQWGAYGRGGAGGKGGIGGSPGRSPLGENYGAYGDSFHGDFKNWPDAQWYMFGDANTGRRLGVAGKGGAPKGGSGPGANGRGNTTLPGTWYGTGGGGRNWWGATGVWWASSLGIVGVRYWEYLPA